MKLNQDKGSNVVRNTVEELISLGYYPAIGDFEPGDLLCLVNKEQNMWAFLATDEEVKYLTKQIKRKEIHPNIVYRHD